MNSQTAWTRRRARTVTLRPPHCAPPFTTCSANNNSSDDRSPPVTTATSAPIPVFVQQPDPPSIDQDSDFHDMMASSDRDIAPASLRTTIHDLQRQLQETQAQLTGARSSDDRSPPVTTATSAPIPVFVQQPDPPSIDQDSDFHDMMASPLQQMSGIT